VSVRDKEGLAVAVLCRGKINALDEAAIDEWNDRFRELGYAGYLLRKRGRQCAKMEGCFR